MSKKSVSNPVVSKTDIDLPPGFKGLLKHLMYHLHVVRPVGPHGVDKYCYEWFANRIAETKRPPKKSDSAAKSAVDDDYLDDNIWKIEIEEPPMLSYGDDEDDDENEDDSSDKAVFDLQNLDPMHVVEDEAARKIQSTYRSYITRRKLKTRRVDAERARRARTKHARKKNADKDGNAHELHWTATEPVLGGGSDNNNGRMDFDDIRADYEQKNREDRDEQERATASAKMNRDFQTRAMLSTAGVDQEEADLAAAKIQATYRKHQIEKTRAELEQLQKPVGIQQTASTDNASTTQSDEKKKKEKKPKKESKEDRNSGDKKKK